MNNIDENGKRECQNEFCVEKKLTKTVIEDEQFRKNLQDFNSIIRKNLKNKDFDTLNEIEDLLHKSLNPTYLEILNFFNNELETKLAKSYNNKSFISFEKLNKSHNIDESNFDELISLKIIKRKKQTQIYCIIRKLHINESKSGYMLIQRETKFSKNEIQIISLFTDYYSLFERKQIYDNLLQKSNKEFRDEISKIRKIQVSLLPKFDLVRNFKIASAFIPATDLSGDFFDGYFLSNTIYQMVLCDVSGHGIASSYVGNQIRTLFRMLSKENRPPSEITMMVNDSLYEDLEDLYIFSTAVVCQINMDTGEMLYLAAGHPPSLLHQAETENTNYITNTGPLLGMAPGNRFTDTKITMNDQDSLLIYTDGVTEAHNPEDRTIFGEERLREEFNSNANLDPQNTVHSVLGSIFEYSQYSEMEDDTTIICIKKTNF